MLKENLEKFEENMGKMKEMSAIENEKLLKLDVLKRNFNVQSAKELGFSRINCFPFECEDSEIFLNFRIGKEKSLVDPCLLYIPLTVNH